MRLELNLYNFSNSPLGFNYNESLRGIILENLENVDRALSKEFHDDPHHIFNFSNILGHSYIKNNNLYIKRGILFISSPDKEFILKSIKGFLKKPLISITNNKTYTKYSVVNMRIYEQNLENINRFQTVSPIILKLKNQLFKDKYQYVYIDNKSTEADIELWKDTLIKSIKSRYEFFTGDSVDYINVNLNSKDFYSKYIKIKNQRYLCTAGKLELNTNSKVKEFINDIGIGSKLKFGFGLLEGVTNE